MSPSSRVPLLLLTALATLPANAGRRDRKQIAEEAAESSQEASTSAQGIPALAKILAEAEWDVTPEMSGIFAPGAIFEQTSKGHQLWSNTCIEAKPQAFPYVAMEMTSALQGGVQVQVGVGSVGASAKLLRKVSFGTPDQITIPKASLRLSQSCVELLEEGAHQGLDLSAFYLIKEVLSAQIRGCEEWDLGASGSVLGLGSADLGASRSCQV